MVKFFMVLVLFVLSTPTWAYQSCQEVVDCKAVKKKLSKQEAACFKGKVVTKTVVVEKQVIVEKPVEKVVIVKKTVFVEKERLKNSLSLLAIATPNKLSVVPNQGTFKADTNYQPDVGIMYQRDLGESFRASAAFSLQGNAVLGLGYNF